MIAPSEPVEPDLLEELGRHLHTATSLLGVLAGDMAAAGARTASERVERALAELRVVGDVLAELGRRSGGTAGR